MDTLPGAARPASGRRTDGTPFGKAAHDARAEHDVLRRATDLAERWGYERRSVWTFNRPGSSSYTSITRPFFVGLGAGAASFTGRLFLPNELAVGRYAQAIEGGELPVPRTLSLGDGGAGMRRQPRNGAPATGLDRRR